MNLTSIVATTDAPINTEQLKRTGAAKDFEALLISQMLHSVRSEGGGWLDTGEDQSSDAAFGLGEEELAKALSQSGGLGLSKVIDAGLKAESQNQSQSQSQPQLMPTAPGGPARLP
jgi:Rod binding domain-containing protein